MFALFLLNNLKNQIKNTDVVLGHVYTWYLIRVDQNRQRWIQVGSKTFWACSFWSSSTNVE